jgi:prevent-host-death family protein
MAMMGVSSMPRLVSIASAKDHLTELIRSVERGEAVELTRRGKPVAALVSIPEYRRMREGWPSFWRALSVFREGLGEKDLAGIEEALRDLRDSSTGREVSW